VTRSVYPPFTDNLPGARAPCSRQNFVVNAVATQYNDLLAPSSAGENIPPLIAELARTLDAIDTFFTALFTSELLVNLYAHWSCHSHPHKTKYIRHVHAHEFLSLLCFGRFHPFWRDGWSVFDFVVIALSLVALGPVDMPISVIRLMRTFRVVRLFGRMKALRQVAPSPLQPICSVYLGVYASGVWQR
jgi:hypothetical protein